MLTLLWMIFGGYSIRAIFKRLPLTYVYQDDMWQYYAANGNGICVEFEVGDYDYLYLVEYCNKSKIDFTRMVISALKRSGMELSIIPWVVKNLYNQTADMDSTKEKEVRMLYCPYDLVEFNGGTIAFNIKERKGYKGIAKPYEDFKLKIEFNITDNDMISYYSIDLYDISSEPIKEIILGPKNNILDRDFELYAAKYNMKNIVLRHSEISFRG